MQENVKKFSFLDSRFGPPAKVYPQVQKYANGQIAIQLLTEEDGFVEPWARLTVALEEFPGRDCVWVKNWSENENLDELAIKAGIIQRRVEKSQISGFVYIDAHKLTPQFLKAMKLDEENANV